MGLSLKSSILAEAISRRARTRVVWYNSLFWKITVFLVSCVVLAYLIGAAVGWVMVERDSLDQWRREAELNAQVTSSAIRTIYTFIAIESDAEGQIVKIVSERPLGDDASILDTGFNPGDVLGLAAAQTRNNVWLFQRTDEDGTFLSSADAFGESAHVVLALPEAAAPDKFYVGFAYVGMTRHFLAFVPVVNRAGQMQGAVVTTIGEAQDLLETQTRLIKSSLALLLTILLATSVIVTILMRKVFMPVPALIDALSRIAHDDTTSVTPFQERNDEIGRFAVAIETVREAVVERENLRQVRDVAREMEHLAHHDALTGLPNRAYFNKRLDTEIAQIDAGLLFNLMLLDLDRFKAVNDSLGHASGDALLVAFAERLSLLMGPRDMAARLGGDEFAILQVVKKDAMREAGQLSKAIIDAASRPFLLYDKEVTVGTSIGVVTAQGQDCDGSTLLKDADIALYHAKSEGRGRYRLFEAGMEMARDRDNEMQHDLETALQNDELILHYQPIFSFSQSEPVAFEALLRWKHPKRGWIAPSDFIPVAEASGQICAIGDWVLRRACLDACQFAENVAVAVNVSAIQIKEGDLGEKIRHALAKSGLPPARLEIELTESVLLQGNAAMQALRDIDALGVGVVLDDFGTGYSSLTYLMTLPINKLKIDRSFVADVMTKSESRAIIQGLVHIADGLGIKTTAEGVETQEQLSLLRAAGCDLVQGFHLGRPMALSDIEGRYRAVNERRLQR